MESPCSYEASVPLTATCSPGSTTYSDFINLHNATRRVQSSNFILRDNLMTALNKAIRWNRQNGFADSCETRGFEEVFEKLRNNQAVAVKD